MVVLSSRPSAPPKYRSAPVTGRRLLLAAGLFALVVAGPSGLLSLDHDRYHDDHGQADADHPDCPVCVLTKLPAAEHPQPISLPELEVERIEFVPHVALPDVDVFFRSPAPRGPPQSS